MKKILYLTDLAYRAKGRNYCEEDIYITSHGSKINTVLRCAIRNAARALKKTPI